MEDNSSDAQQNELNQRLFSNENVILRIKEEQLNLVKEWIQTAQVKIYREAYTYEKSFTVPVIREELVIEKTDLVSPDSKHINMSPEVIRIVLSEEQVDFVKHTVNFEDVSIYKQQINEIIHIEETLKHEEPRVKIIGSPTVKDE